MHPTDSDSLHTWFRNSGVAVPLRSCHGPLPQTGAAIVRWTGGADAPAVHTISPHPEALRLSLVLEPLESQIWQDGRPLWAGLIAAGQFRLSGPEGAQQWRQLSPCDMVNLFIPLDAVRALARSRGEHDLRLGTTPFTADPQVRALVLPMLDAQNAAGRLADRFCDHLVQALLAYLLEHYADFQGAAARGRLCGARLRRLQQHLQAHLAEELPVAELASLCGLSESHFTREFKQAFGVPPHQHLLRLRLRRACELLARPELSISRIALDCGFGSLSHFSRAFSARLGHSPQAFRREKLGLTKA